jgi:Flp pilus assembly protein TadD
MRFRSAAGILGIGLALSIAQPAPAQEWTGRGRLEGTVKNEKGEPIASAAISLRWKQSAHGGPDVKTDQKGKWVYLGLAGGEWTYAVGAAGYVPQSFGVSVMEFARNQPVDVKLQAQQQAAPQPEAHEELQVGGKTITKDASEAIERGNAAFAAKNFPEAREAYLRALQELPDNAPLTMRVAAVYAAENNNEEALKYARKASELDPNETYAWLLVATIEMQNGNVDAGKAALDKIPPDKIKQPDVYLNLGILLYNKKKSAEAEVAFGKALAISPDLADAYYYRGLARLGLKNKPGAKEDFQKYLELAPDGSESKDAKELLNSIR